MNEPFSQWVQIFNPSDLLFPPLIITYNQLQYSVSHVFIVFEWYAKLKKQKHTERYKVKDVSKRIPSLRLSSRKYNHILCFILSSHKSVMFKFTITYWLLTDCCEFCIIKWRTEDTAFPTHAPVCFIKSVASFSLHFPAHWKTPFSSSSSSSSLPLVDALSPCGWLAVLPATRRRPPIVRFLWESSWWRTRWGRSRGTA